MRKRLTCMLVIGAFLMSLGLVATREAGAQMRRMPVVRNMDITGEIAKMDNGYIIRGKVPAEIFTILNPMPKTLDSFVKSGKIVRLHVKIVSGDNVEIEKIDGKSYADAGRMKKEKEVPARK